MPTRPPDKTAYTEVGMLSDEPEIPEISPEPPKQHKAFIGFAAGIASGWTKLVVGHPFDTIKTRCKCDMRGYANGSTMLSAGHVRWSMDLLQVDSQQGGTAGIVQGRFNTGHIVGYNGFDLDGQVGERSGSIVYGSLHNYRAFLAANGFSEQTSEAPRLSLMGHTVAGAMAGWTNCLIAHPTELIKCKLQMQMIQPDHVPKQFAGPIDVIRKTVAEQGVTGMWKGVGASFIYRSCFAAMFGGFEIFNRLFKSWDGTSWQMSTPAANFLAGGIASNMYWFTALPLDNVKNRILVDDLKKPRYHGVVDAYKKTWWEMYDPKKNWSWNSIARVKNFYRGFVPVVLRAFPTNAAALAVWEGVMRWSNS